MPLPIRKHRPNPRRIRQFIHFLKVLLAQRKRLGGDVGDVLPNQLGRIDGCLVDFLEQKGAEGFHARTQEGRVEGDVDTLKRDNRKASLKVDGLRL